MDVSSMSTLVTSMDVNSMSTMLTSEGGNLIQSYVDTFVPLFKQVWKGVKNDNLHINTCVCACICICIYIEILSFMLLHYI
jgi:hypothetical protein